MSTPTSERPVPAGWYQDIDVQGQQRYWDGKAWTEHVAPILPPPPPSAGPANAAPPLAAPAPAPPPPAAPPPAVSTSVSPLSEEASPRRRNGLGIAAIAVGA